jgi:two-component system NarL family response regulator
MSQSKAIRVLLVDDHPIVRQGLAAIVERQPDMTVIAQAGDGQEAVELFRQQQPDVTLMDLRMPQMGGVEAITTICAEFENARIVVLTTYDGDEDIYRGLRAGAKGYLLKDAKPDQLLTAIRIVHSGQQYIPLEVGAKLVERMSNPELSDRELEVLRLMAKGKSNQQIGTALSITERTVKFHVNNIFSKLGVDDRIQAVIVALKRGIASL